MDKQFIAIVQKLISEQGKEVLFNASKCKPLLGDYTGTEYKKEKWLLTMAVEAGVTKAIDSTQEIEICKQQQIRLLQDNYSIVPGTAADVVDMLSFVLRGKTATAQPQPTAPQSQQPVAPLLCLQCGKAIKQGSAFCGSCGAKAEVSQVSVATSPPINSQEPSATKRKPDLAMRIIAVLGGFFCCLFFKGVFTSLLELIGWLLELEVSSNIMFVLNILSWIVSVLIGWGGGYLPIMEFLTIPPPAKESLRNAIIAWKGPIIGFGVLAAIMIICSPNGIVDLLNPANETLRKNIEFLQQQMK